MSYEEETTDLRAQVRELALEAAKERSLAEQATRARNTAQAKVRKLEQALDEAPSPDRLRELEAELAEWRQFRERMFVANSEGAFNVIHALRDSLRETKARAEKAEAAAWTEAGAAQIHFEARQHLEARVAELTSWIQAYADWSSGRRGARWPGEPIRLLAREREESK